VVADIPAGVDHGGLSGLSDDDHTQYHTDARALTWLGTRSTTDLPEGTNLYYTAARFSTAFASKSTTDLAEGTNLYYTAARFNTAFASKSTTDLAEGTNLTDARARTAAVSQSITNGVTTTAPSEDAVFDALALKASTALSNLASVAINTALLPATNGNIDFGSSSFRWAALYHKQQLLYGNTSGVLTINAGATTTDYAITWPSTQGAASSVLTNNGSGVLSWSAVSGVQSFTDTWTTGTSKTVTHSLSTRDVMVYVYDLDSPYQMVEVDTVEHTSTSAVTLTASSAPTGAGRKVLVIKIA
jgi:hypothetical protein